MRSRISRAAIVALLTALVAGSTAQVLLMGISLPCTLVQIWLPVCAVALVLALGSLHRLTGLGAFAVLLALGAAFLLPRRALFAPLTEWVRTLTMPGVPTDQALLSQAAALIVPVTAAWLALCMFAFMWANSGTPFAILVFFAAAMVGYSLEPEMSFRGLIPGLVGCAAAFALSGQVQRSQTAWRALIAAGLAVALAFWAVPGDRLTWAPLERAAAQVRAIFEDYFRFTEERIPFTITAEGFNMAVQEDDDIVSRLGGPATPHTDPVMEVTASRQVLLRGAIKRTYTGANWIDPDAKSRYLYYDLLRRDIRTDVFNMHDNDAFDDVDVTVTFLREGTSALFVPSRLRAFHMDLENAVYFNSIGEMFLSRQTTAGDTYQLEGCVLGDGEALRALTLENMAVSDETYQDAIATCLQLPDGIEEGVYRLTNELTSGFDNPYDKVRAIEGWLKSNCTYTLEPDIPDLKRDFVSEFVLGTRRGYCSYFASAMTVMCRIAGIPARYVEGYSAEASSVPVALTGENAHAWTEVCFSGIGWVSFDASNGGTSDGDSASGQSDPPDGGQDQQEQDDGGQSDDGQGDQSDQDRQGGGAENPPTPTPEPQDEDQNNSGGGSQSEADAGLTMETPTPEPPVVTPPPEQDERTDDDDQRHHPYWWLALILLLMAALAVWMRLRQTDPIRLSDKAKTPEEGMAILYRATLTLLKQTGRAPMQEETPTQFARRVADGDGGFAQFADQVSRMAYSRQAPAQAEVKAGQEVYRSLLKRMTLFQKLRYARVRVFKGPGRFDVLP